MTPADIRTAFPEFQDQTKYPDATVQLWLDLAVSMVDPNRWGQLTDQGIRLCTAHYLALGAVNARAASVGGVPGQVSGPLSSKSVDKVSASYDTGKVALDNAGFWNQTTYGIQFFWFARMAGAGGMQL